MRLSSAALGLVFVLALECPAGTAQEPLPPPVPAPTDDPSFAAFADLVEANYFREIPKQKLLADARDGMLAGLDPYSRYLPPAEWAWLRRSLAAQFGGVGVFLRIDEASQRPQIRRLLIGSAAGDAGIVAGDVILSIDGRSTEGMTLDDVTLALPGAVGSTVRVSVQRVGSAEIKDFALVRRIVKTPSVRGGRRNARGLWTEYLYDARNRIGYVRIAWLADDTVRLVDEAMKSLDGRRLRGLVLDLRDDEGGSFNAAVGVADLFLDSGRIVSETGRDGVEEVEEATPPGFVGFPMAVLVNQHTASASEILASALQDNGRAVVFGERTFGKGLVQKLFPLGDGNEGLRLTVSAYRRASGGNVDRFTAPKGSSEWGVCPDPGFEVFVPPAPSDPWVETPDRGFLPTPLELAMQGPADERDPVLEVALQWLQSRLREGSATKP